MTAALAIWPLEGSHVVACDESGSYALDCWTDYLLVSTEQLELPANLGKTLPRRESGEHQALVNFADYVGELNIGGSRLRVSTPKLDAEGFDALLRDITARCASLPFDFRSPTFIPYERAALDERDLLYHAFVYLRWAMWWAKPNLVEVLATIESDPHRMLVRETIDSPLWAVRSVGPAMLEDALRSAGRWQELPTGSQAAQFPLARRVAGLCGRAAVPTSLREHVAKTTLDTPENRFVRYFVEFLGELLDRLVERLGRGGVVEKRIVAEATTLRRELGERTHRGFLREVGTMTVFPASSQVLQRRSGYRELLSHYLALMLAARYPISGADLTRLMESKQASLLYEYWTFFEMADLLRALVGEPLEATTLVRSDELTTQVPENEIRIRYPGDIELAYNRSFAGNLGGSYSVTLRPDITLDVGETRHFFDAKFRVERPPAPAASIDEAEELAVAASLPKGWFKAEDVRKMHTYREAIGGCPGAKAMPVGSVWVLYPGTEFVYFDQHQGRLHHLPESATRPQGVGAIPLAPGEGSGELESVVARLLQP